MLLKPDKDIIATETHGKNIFIYSHPTEFVRISF
jgi:hypothetical protein